MIQKVYFIEKDTSGFSKFSPTAKSKQTRERLLNNIIYYTYWFYKSDILKYSSCNKINIILYQYNLYQNKLLLSLSIYILLSIIGGYEKNVQFSEIGQFFENLF